MEPGTWLECSTVAEKNLSDPTLPRYWIVKNVLIQVHASDDWNASEKYLLWAESVYTVGLFRYQQQAKHSIDDEVALQDLKESLDEARRLQEEDRPLTGPVVEVDPAEIPDPEKNINEDELLPHEDFDAVEEADHEFLGDEFDTWVHGKDWDEKWAALQRAIDSWPARKIALQEKRNK